MRNLSGAPLPKSIPYPLLIDAAATVSATYGAAFQQDAFGFRSNRQMSLVIDGDGIIRARFDGDSPRLSCLAGPKELRGGDGYDLLDAVIDLPKQRADVETLLARGPALRSAASLVLRPMTAETKAAVPTLAAALRSDDEQTRVGAAAALYWITPLIEDPSPMILAIGDENEDVRRRAMLGLMRLMSGADSSVAIDALPRLVTLLGDNDRQMRIAAEGALRRLGPAAREALQGGRESDDVLVRVSSVVLLRGGQVEIEDANDVPPQIRKVSFWKCPTAGNADLAHLADLRGLKSLVLMGTRVSDDGLKHLARLDSLEELNLGNTRVTDDGLAQLTHLKNLTRLDLPKQIGDGGLLHLVGLTNLQRLVIARGNGVTDDGVQFLKEALPDVSIKR